MTADRLAQTVRQQLGLGRLLSLGEAADGVWIAERAAAAVLRAAVASADSATGAGLRSLRLALADPEGDAEPAVPPPPSALPPGPVRITADFAAPVDQPLPQTADRLREVLGQAADERLGLPVTAIDLHATDLLEQPGSGAPARQPALDPDPDAAPGTEEPPATAADRGSVADAVTAVPGVAGLSPALGGLGGPGGLAHAARTIDSPTGRQVHLQLAVAAGHRALDVARAARDAAVSAASVDAPGPVTATILVTAVAV
ncbi:nucleopolyhedrovirus P10 family protein [Streptomyces gobiensis]|uniref:nucleopolyhedrovirus P10 family protein n=1 Tax=Streptomyces gobiensis TaxID=2875706 RepID=UPI001E30C176|nr:nucleopolyhedrovirus P10 family protein [Streptomyces gobiensis]UGY90664.1 nucleopolyhedrovirus P10 family protein [Streptomyces gobiensis]